MTRCTEDAGRVCLPWGLARSSWRGSQAPKLKEEEGFTGNLGRRRSRQRGLNTCAVQASGGLCWPQISLVGPGANSAPHASVCSFLHDRVGWGVPMTREGLPGLGPHFSALTSHCALPAPTLFWPHQLLKLFKPHKHTPTSGPLCGHLLREATVPSRPRALH